MQEFVQLNSSSASLVIALTPVAEIVHWGKRLAPLTETQWSAFVGSQRRAIANARLDQDVPLTLCPELGRGSFGSPGIEGHRDGEHSMPRFEPVLVHQDDAHQVSIVCEDALAALRLVVQFQLDASSNVLRQKMTLTNLGETPYQLQKLALTLPVPARANCLESYYGRWSREFQAHRQTIEHGAWSVENRRGRTSHEYFPGCLVGTAHFSEQQGEVWSFHLGWSGNHQWRCEAKSDGRRFVQAGELLLPGEITLAPAQSYSTPEWFASYSAQGVNGIRTHQHRFVREQIVPFDRNEPRPVHLNTWEGIYFDHDPDYICQMASEAAALGVERFIIDDGWFIGRNDDTSSLGDWVLDKTKYPQGLMPVIEHVQRLGMTFGLWVEPEMVNPDSELFRRHPEWLLAAAGYEAPTGRNQYLLDLQIPECFNYLFSTLDALLSDYPIGYLKWDMNRELVQPTHNGRAAVHGQTMALYRLIDQLIARHPDVEIESCASGGGRIDYEILKRTCRFWTSDCNDALERQSIQKHMGIFFPPEVMGAHIGPYHSHTTRRSHDIQLRGLTALTGHMGVELDPVKAAADEKQAFARYIALHKHHRYLLHHGNSFYLDSSDQSRWVYGVEYNGDMLVVVCQLRMPDYALVAPILLPNLDIEKWYRVSMLDYPAASAGLMKPNQGWWNESSLVVKGEWLCQVGLSLPLLDPESGLLLSVEVL
ncbi:alpha-galactosidase [Celerinatantimonas diazotrophica]|uniref:Alpha-galactosidase n=1 Tax=Celerinatantimonas diazotrophica TaxID=412034 RepID=A0A4R1J7A5_9GAMM|nr:alpha-galactosidase [Celerinatantimonas diazotrophica]TCK46319.1 alpha-galactosidase [Celerinatantimonas diazotrophica]CAG9295307.1 Alpha-galactosidase [Celerinatantimonas diazotrophica]